MPRLGFDGDLVAGVGNVAIGALNAYQNYQNLEYLKEVQRTTWEREDTAAQRAVADMRAAGLSPTLAAGHFSPTSAPIRTEAPQVEINPLQVAQAVLGLSKQREDISKTNAETRLLEIRGQYEETETQLRLEGMKRQNEYLYEKGYLTAMEARRYNEVINQRLRLMYAQERVADATSEREQYNTAMSAKWHIRTTDRDKYLSYLMSGSQALEDLADQAIKGGLSWYQQMILDSKGNQRMSTEGSEIPIE